MAHWYTPFWDLEIKKGLGFKPSWCAGETSVAPQPMSLTWGGGARRVPTACQVGSAVVIPKKENPCRQPPLWDF
jgi:hypothetical protein